MDILTALQDSGVDFLVVNILLMLRPPDLCSLFQVSSRWNGWDTSYLWTKVLAGLMKGKDERTCFVQEESSKKESSKILWRLKQAWRKSDCNTKSVNVDSSVLSVWGNGSSVVCGLNSGMVEEWRLVGERIR